MTLAEAFGATADFPAGDPEGLNQFSSPGNPSSNIKICEPQRTGAAKPVGEFVAWIMPELRRWSAAEGELMDCPSLESEHRLRDQARRAGITNFAGRAVDPFDALCADAVVFLPAGRFEFARDMRDQTGARSAIIAAARNIDGDVIDIAAIDLATGAVATWCGRAALLGGENILRTRPRLETSLMVHASVIEWLRANREGVFILDHRRAADTLDGLSIAVESIEHGQRLQHALTRPAPPIVVRKAMR